MPTNKSQSMPDVLPPASVREPMALTWTEPTGMVGLSIVNFLLRIVTFGLHHFWGKTEVRRRIWSAMRLNGEPLSYTGTGKELLIGFMVAFVVLFLPVFAISLAAALYADPDPEKFGLWDAAGVGVYIIMFALIGLAVYRAQRYRLSRTNWRGIRGALIGHTGHYAWTYIWTAALIPLTLGWIGPWRQTKLQGLLMNDTRFGDRPMSFDAPTGPLYGRFAVLWFGGIVITFATLAILGLIFEQSIRLAMQGLQVPPNRNQIAATVITLLVAGLLLSIASAWYRAGQFNHFAAHTMFEGARFKGTMTAGGLIWLAVSNFFIVVLTLTVLAPVAQARTARYFIENLAIEGTVPLSSIAQSAARQTKTGEGLAQAFDVDAF